MQHVTENSPLNESIRDFIYKQFPLAQEQQLGETDPLLQNGVIDSLGTLDVVAFLEEEFHIVIDDDDLVAEHFESISTIANLVASKRS
ncbi:acyl carrier protein [Rubinisphaera margarita]|uniref:acyl carrier protein n=1 Tax=Rubinisphaera margarita TaxID=2909586 RepID=UPI001EE974D1|nr:acyl carrier protein [Rubinisphaera margarita]MCG6155286.1 acyl carrier protein [Rubinisphaera margarita]